MPDPNQKGGGLSWSQPSSQPKETPKPAPSAPKQAPSLMPQPNTSSSKNNNDKKKSDTTTLSGYAGFIVAGVIVGVLVAWGWSAFQNRETPVATTSEEETTMSEETGTTATTETTGSSAVTSNASFAVSNPQAAGTSVAISSINVSSPTWIVVYENRDNKPGNILGAGLFFADQTSGKVELLRGTVAGQTYYVGTRTDNGDRRFELDVDDPVRAGSTQPLVSFTTN